MMRYEQGRRAERLEHCTHGRHGSACARNGAAAVSARSRRRSHRRRAWPRLRRLPPRLPRGSRRRTRIDQIRATVLRPRLWGARVWVRVRARGAYPPLTRRGRGRPRRRRLRRTRRRRRAWRWCAWTPGRRRPRSSTSCGSRSPPRGRGLARANRGSLGARCRTRRSAGVGAAPRVAAVCWGALVRAFAHPCTGGRVTLGQAARC